jgi:hypothetical protein
MVIESQIRVYTFPLCRPVLGYVGLLSCNVMWTCRYRILRILPFFLYLYIYLFIYLFIYIFIHLPIYFLFVYLVVCLFI